MALSNWLASPTAIQASAPSSNTMVTRSPRLRRSRSSIEATSALTSTARLSSDWRREKASSRWVSAAAPLGRRQRHLDQAAQVLGFAVGDAAAHDLHAAHDAHQHVVEIMGQAAGQLADRLHLLALAQ